jgi:hypothetical protein
VSLTIRVDATGNGTIASANGQRVINVAQPKPCHRPPNATLDQVTVTLTRTDTYSGGDLGGGQVFGGVDFQPDFVLIVTDTMDQSVDFTQPNGNGTFDDCVTAPSHSSVASNPVASGVNFSGTSITDVNGVVTGFDFNQPPAPGKSGTIDTVITFSGQLLRLQ